MDWMRLEVGILVVFIIWTVFELIRAVVWEIIDILNNYKGKGE